MGTPSFPASSSQKGSAAGFADVAVLREELVPVRAQVAVHAALAELAVAQFVVVAGTRRRRVQQCQQRRLVGGNGLRLRQCQGSRRRWRRSLEDE